MDQKNRMPPGQFLSNDLPIKHVGPIPTFLLQPGILEFGGQSKNH